MMALRRINFAYLGLRVDVFAADPELNPVFAAMFAVNQRPYHLAIQLGRLSEETAQRMLARTYAGAVIKGSPDVVRSPAQWEEWLLQHPEEFAQLRSLCEHPDNFHEGTDGDGPGRSGDAPAADQP